ncbi:MAG: BLUF domain-containing protein [Pseudomonadota bacterium]
MSSTTLSKDEIEREMANIATTAQDHNAKQDITGVLFFENGHFLQALEGEEAKLRELYNRITNDPRHKNLNTLVDTPISKRSFSDWSMDTFFVDTPELINPETIKTIRSLYSRTFDMNTQNLISFIKKMVDEMDTFKILNEAEA